MIFLLFNLLFLATFVSQSQELAPKSPMSVSGPSVKVPKAPASEELKATPKSKKSDGKCPEHDAVATFQECFASGVKECESLCRLFDIKKDIGIDEFSTGKFYMSTAIFAQERYKHSAANAEKIIKYMDKDCSRLDSDFLVSVYSGSVSKFLAKNKKLTKENAAELADKFVSAMKATAKRTVNEDYPSSQVASLPMGYSVFLLENKLIEPSQGEELSTFFSEEWKSLSKKGGKAKDVPSVVCKEPKNPLKPSDKFCKVESKEVEKFTAAFRKSVRASKTLSRLFNLCDKMAPSDFSRGVLYSSLFLLQIGGVKDTSVLADFMSKYVEKVQKLERPALVGVYANFVAKFLLSEKVLTCDRAERFAAKYAQFMERAANLIETGDHPRAGVVAMSFGWRDFLQHCKLFTADKGSKIAYYYGNEWYCQSLSCEE